MTQYKGAPLGTGTDPVRHCVRTVAALDPQDKTRFVYSAAYTTVFLPPQMGYHPSTNQSHNCLTSIIMVKGVLPLQHDAIAK